MSIPPHDPLEPDVAPSEESLLDAPNAAEDICPVCGGSGSLPDSECPECAGTGFVVRDDDE
jgi:DnaJ-class molecular chaperone